MERIYKPMRKIQLFLLFFVLGLALTACSLFGSAEATDETARQTVQNTPNAQLVNLQHAVQADTSVPLNTVGQNINLKFNVTNAGTEGITGTVIITGAAATCPAMNTVGNLNDALDPTETLPCTAAYPITQADLDRGSVSFLTTASISGINSAPVTTTVTLAQSKLLTLTTSAAPSTYDQAGRQVVFTYVIKNGSSSDVGPGQFTISDSLISTAPFNCGDTNTTLTPNATVTCTSTYTVTEANVSAASITSVATASGPGAGPSQSTSVTVNKGAVSQPAPANLTAGNTIKHIVIDGDWLWQIARCYGADPNKVIEANTQLADPAQISPDMQITVPNIGSKGTIYGTPCVVKHTVKTGETWTSIAQLYNADPTILQIANSNTLTVGNEINIPRNSAGTLGVSTKTLTLTITANPTSYDQVGQQIAYTYVIRNSGNVSLGPDQFTVTDTLISASAFNCGNAGTSLAPNATITCSANYTIKDTDMNAFSINNAATASGGGASPSQTATAAVSKVTRALTITTTANPATYNLAGQQITFTYVIKNSGTANLGPTQFTVTDTLIGPTAFNCGAADAALAPNATLTCTSTYTIKDTDVSAVSITSSATATGGGAGPSQPVNTTVTKQ